MTIRDTDTARIAQMRRTLEICVEKLDDIAGDLGEGFTPLAIAQRLKILSDLCVVALRRDEEAGGKR